MYGKAAILGLILMVSMAMGDGNPEYYYDDDGARFPYEKVEKVSKPLSSYQKLKQKNNELILQLNELESIQTKYELERVYGLELKDRIFQLQDKYSVSVKDRELTELKLKKFERDGLNKYELEQKYGMELKDRILELQAINDLRAEELKQCESKEPVVIVKEAPIENYIAVAIISIILGAMIW